MVASSHSILAGLTLLLAGPAPAQSRTAGRVVRAIGRDTVPVVRTEVVLHRVGRAAQGPIDTTTTDRAGRFAFRFLADSTATYLLSVRFEGIEYFSAPIASNPARPDTAVTIIVADTSSSAPVGTSERTLLISRPDESGTRAVVDWFVLANFGERTRVAVGTLRPSWSAPLPPAAQNVELADAALSQFSPEALEFRNDSVLVFAPLSPGRKELVLQYRIPGALRAFRVPSAEGTESLFVLLEEKDARVVFPRLAIADSQRLDGRPFRRWVGATRGASSLEIALPGPPVARGTILVMLVAVAGLGFAALALFTLRRRGPQVPLHPGRLAEAIARLDADRLEPAAALTPEEERRYLEERARLKQALEHALAEARRRS